MSQNDMYNVDAAYDAWAKLIAKYDLATMTRGQKAALSKLWHKYCRLAILAGLDPVAYAKRQSQP